MVLIHWSHGESIFIPCNYRALLGLADAIRFGLLAEGIPLALEPGKKDFQEGMQQAAWLIDLKVFATADLEATERTEIGRTER